MKKKWALIGAVFIGLLVGALAFTGIVQAAPDGAPLLAPVGTAFTYQGYIEDLGSPANGSYNLRFLLWDAASGGAQVGSTQTKNGVSVVDGVFSVTLDFGSVFDGTALWLTIKVKGPGDPGYTTLNPRQALTPVPYASYANTAPWSGLTGAPWAYFSGSGASGELYRSGDVALGALTDPDGHGLNVQNYTGGKAAVRGVEQLGSTIYSEGQLGVLSPSGLPLSLTNAGVLGLKPANGNRGAAVYGWNSDNESSNYGGVFIADGPGTSNYGIYASASGASTTNVAGYFTGQNRGVYGLGNNDYGGYFSSSNYRGLYAEGASGWYDGYFGGTQGIFVNGTCTGCRLATIVQNSGRETLQTGDLVAISGVTANYDANATTPIITVSKLDANNSQAILGVVSARYVTNLSSAESGRSEVVYQEYTDPETGDVSLTPVDQAVGDQSQGKSGYVTQESIEPGDFAVVIYSGMAQVKADATSGKIQVGDVLLTSTTSNGVISLRTVEPGANVQGSTIGKALEPLADKTGLVWVLVDPR
ncbi:MAG: hypothetical protein ACC700_18470 [Anaerolineales bacterium]